MEALLNCARNNISCRNATLYATTFPCHNCAKHIIAAGIKRVVYIEPYPKSKAFSFYKNEITDDKRDMEKKVLFEHFIGVGPHKFIDLFAITSDRWYSKKRKDKEGHKVDWEKEKAELRNPMTILTFLDSEKIALMSFEEETVAVREGGGGSDDGKEGQRG